MGPANPPPLLSPQKIRYCRQLVRYYHIFFALCLVNFTKVSGLKFLHSKCAHISVFIEYNYHDICNNITNQHSRKRGIINYVSYKKKSFYHIMSWQIPSRIIYTK